MRWKRLPRKDYTQWHEWFAWKPVVAVTKGLGSDGVWLETIERRWVPSEYGPYSGNWKYRFGPEDKPEKI